MLKKKIMAYVHQLLDQPSQWQTSQQAGPCSVPKFTNTSITVKHLLIKNKNISQSKSSLLIWHYMSYLFLFKHTAASLGNISRLMTKPTQWHVRPAKTQISLGFHPVWAESSLCAHWVAKDPSFLHADNEDSDQTRRMPRLIWVFAERTCHFAGFVMRRLISNYITSNLGVKRGDPSSSLLFMMFVNDILTNINSNLDGIFTVDEIKIFLLF